MAGSDGIKWEVRPGVFDDDAREACVSGQCHALALALNQRFSWPLVGVFDELEDLIHVAVTCPDGRILDADGYYAGEDHLCSSYAQDYGLGDYVKMVDVKDVLTLASDENWRVPNVDLAATWIDELLETAGPVSLPLEY